MDYCTQAYTTMVLKKQNKICCNKRKWFFRIFSIGIILTLLVIGVGCSAEKGEYSTVSAVIKADGSEAYIPLPYGEIIEIGGYNNSLIQVSITPDRKHVITYNGMLTSIYSQDLQTNSLKGKWSRGDCFPHYWGISDDGLIFEKYDGQASTYYRLDFETMSETKISSSIRTYSENNATVLFNDNNDLFVLPAGESERTLIASSKKNDGLHYYGRAVSNDGKTVLFSIWDGGDTGGSILWEDGEEFVLKGSSGESYGIFSSDQKIAVVSDGESLWIKERGKEPVSTAIKGEILRPYWTNAGRLQSAPSSKIKKIYVEARNSDGSYSLYQVSLDGEKDRLLSSVKSVSFGSDHVAYVDKNGDLYIAAVGKMELEAEEIIARDVSSAILCGSEKYLYYFKDVSNEAGTLYGHKIGDNSSVRIASNVLIKDRASTTCVSEDGKTIVFIKDMTDADSPMYLGNASDGIECKLMIWHYGDKEPNRIALDSVVCTQSMKPYKISAPCFEGKSFLVGVFTDSKGFYYYRWNGSGYDLMRYTGKESEKIASDVRLGEWW